MNLSSAEIERYARQIVLRGLGGPGQNKLKTARALVIGAGGLGSPALQYLAGAGIGTLGIVVDDPERPDAGPCQILEGGRTQASSANHEGARGLELVLAGSPNPMQNDLARVALNLLA